MKICNLYFYSLSVYNLTAVYSENGDRTDTWNAMTVTTIVYFSALLYILLNKSSEVLVAVSYFISVKILMTDR